jgi:hypothetical protein
LLHEMARRALALLRAGGVAGDRGSIQATVMPGEGSPIEILYHGADLPGSVPGSVADYQYIADQPPGWQGAHRLVVRAPLVVFDLCWNPDEPLRIMGFSRGDWERALMEAAA